MCNVILARTLIVLGTLRHFRSKALELQHLQVQSKEVKQKKTKHEWGLHISVH